MSTTGTALTQGTVVAETYEVQRLLGRGGMGEVWAATHRRLPGKSVAIKVLHTETGPLPAEALARFRREAEIAARLSHPNIVEVLDFNTLPTGQPYLVMELLRGESLADVLSRGPLEPARLVSMVRQIASALKAAHELGVVHRDLKPENVFVSPTEMGDQVKVLDFGISKLAGSQTVKTTDAVLIGTPLYMSPEQAKGNNSDVSPQSDVFSLASICYEALTGARAFEAESIARVVFRIAYEQPTPLTQLRPNVPAPVVQAIEHALQKDRAQRTPDIASFVLELTGESLQTRPMATPMDAPSSASVTDPASLSLGATQAPSRSHKAPEPASLSAIAGTVASASKIAVPPAAAPVQAAVPAKKTPWLLMGVAGAALAGGAAFFLRPTPVIEQPPVVNMVDAGAAVVAVSPTKVVDAVVDAGASAEVVDAGAAAEVVDAGLAAPLDAGAQVAPTHAVPKELPMSAADKALIAETEKLRADTNWQTIIDQHQSRQVRLETPAAKRRELGLAIEAACALRLQRATSFLTQMQSEYGAAARKSAVAPCKVSWPERDW